MLETADHSMGQNGKPRNRTSELKSGILNLMRKDGLFWTRE